VINDLLRLVGSLTIAVPLLIGSLLAEIAFVIAVTLSVVPRKRLA